MGDAFVKSDFETQTDETITGWNNEGEMLQWANKIRDLTIKVTQLEEAREEYDDRLERRDDTIDNLKRTIKHLSEAIRTILEEQDI